MNTARNFLIILPLMVFAAVTRFIPHPFNFTAIGALALFGGAVISDKRLAFLLPLVVMFITDAFIGFHSSMIPVYLCFTAAVFIGMTCIRKVSFLSVGLSSLASSVLFFLVTNLPFWYADISLYPLTWLGMIESYTLALPFFGNQIAGDFFYSTVLFVSYVVLKERFILVPVEKK